MKLFSIGCATRCAYGTWPWVILTLCLSACSANRIHTYPELVSHENPGEWQIFAQREGVLMTLYVSRGGVKNAQPIRSGTLEFYRPVITDNGRYAAYVTGHDLDFKLWFQEVSSRRNAKPLMVERYEELPQSLRFENDSRTLVIDAGLATESQFNVRELGIRLRKTN